MGRPKSANPKNKHIGIVTTEEKFRRFKALGLIGDEAIDVLLYHLENDKLKQKIEKSQLIKRIKEINKEMEELEFEKLKLETQLEQINIKIGVNAKTGLDNNVNSALEKVLQRYENYKEIYSLHDFVMFNEEYVRNQAFLANMDFEKFKELIYEVS